MCRSSFIITKKVRSPAPSTWVIDDTRWLEQCMGADIDRIGTE